MYDRACEYLKEYTVLVVEDDASSLLFLSQMLKRCFKSVITASNGEEAYDRLITKDVDIILTDMRMPAQNGADFIKQIREMEYYSVPVVFMSAHKDVETLLQIIPLNISEYMIKPINVESFLRLATEVLQKKKALSEEHSPLYRTYKLTNGIVVDLEKKIVKKGEEDILLTKKEFELLALFIHRRYAVLDKSEIEYVLWNGDVIAESSVKTLIKKLRAKIGEESIVTIKNLGYKIF